MIPNPATIVAPTTAPYWFDELDLSPGGPPVLHMGLAALPENQLLVTDTQRVHELAHKVTILEKAKNETVVWCEDVEASSQELLKLVIDDLRNNHDICAEPQTGVHPIEATTRIAQEDFTLVRRTGDGPKLVAAAVCFPNGWFPSLKVGLPLAAVHEPIPRYAQELQAKVDRIFMHLAVGRPLWRRNWFIYDNPALYNPAHDNRGLSSNPMDLYIRSERETMFMLPDSTDSVFTIRTQQVHIDALAHRPDIAAKIALYFRQSPQIVQHHKGIVSYPESVLSICDRYALG